MPKRKPKVTGIVEAAPLDIDALLAKRPKNRIARIGVEIEGGWKTVPQGARLERDGSVFKAAGDAGGFKRDKYPDISFGELNTGIIQPAGLRAGLKKLWPDMVDNSCGLHVHMSFPTLFIYSLLMSHPEYQETVVKYIFSWAKEKGLPEDHPIWDRLADKSVYCQKKWWPDLQVEYHGKDHNQQRPGHRYTMIHFCWREGRQRTVECRLMPMMETPELSAEAIQIVLDITNACIVKLSKGYKIPSVEGTVELRDNEEYKETVTEIV